MFKKRSSGGGHSSEFSRVYQDGELICQEGETSAEMFVIQSGSVRIFKAAQHGEVELAVLKKGDFFGEMSVLETLPRDASAQAVGDTEVLVMPAGALLIRLRRDPTFAFELLHRLSGRVRGLNARLMGALDRVSPSVHRALEDPAESLLYIPETQDAPEPQLPSLPQVNKLTPKASINSGTPGGAPAASPIAATPSSRGDSNGKSAPGTSASARSGTLQSAVKQASPSKRGEPGA